VLCSDAPPRWHSPLPSRLFHSRGGPSSGPSGGCRRSARSLDGSFCASCAAVRGRRVDATRRPFPYQGPRVGSVRGCLAFSASSRPPSDRGCGFRYGSAWDLSSCLGGSSPVPSLAARSGRRGSRKQVWLPDRCVRGAGRGCSQNPSEGKAAYGSTAGATARGFRKGTGGHRKSAHGFDFAAASWTRRLRLFSPPLRLALRLGLLCQATCRMQSLPPRHCQVCWVLRLLCLGRQRLLLREGSASRFILVFP